MVSKKILAINRKLWVALANDQVSRRRRLFGKAFAKPCSTCPDILRCEGPIGIHMCRTIHKMQDEGIITGLKRIPFQKLRRKVLPISRECLVAYGLLEAKEETNEKAPS